MFYRLTPNLVLRSPWRPYPARPGERVLTCWGSGVFPPGHPTTRLCLDLLQEVMAAAPGERLLDLGCGSGVLALAGAALGATLCVGVDLSRQAALISRDNARKNGLGTAVLVVQGSTQCLRGPFELILANLPWEVQLEKVAELSRLAPPSGRLILSGFRDTQEDELWRLYQSEGWRRSRRLYRDEWTLELPPEKSFTWAAWLLKRS
jgi:ribosomal protein L11 methyltransferase